jgi:2-polyprenyl-6-methoxyphenol hydroxylase-like FAD-dependent oxidoreductase
MASARPSQLSQALPSENSLDVLIVGAGPTGLTGLRLPTRGSRSSCSATSSGDEALVRGPLALEELQSVVDSATGATVQLRDPVWLTHFRLHHRQAARYRSGRLLLAGNAAHIHSPVGAP